MVVVAVAAAALVFGSSTPTRSPAGGAAKARKRSARTIRTWSSHVPGPAPAPVELPPAREHVAPPIQGTAGMAAWVVPLRGQPALGEGWDPAADEDVIVASEAE